MRGSVQVCIWSDTMESRVSLRHVSTTYDVRTRGRWVSAWDRIVVVLLYVHMYSSEYTWYLEANRARYSADVYINTYRCV